VALSCFLILVGAPEGSGQLETETLSEGGDAMLAYLDRTVGIAEEKFLDLGDALPENLYDWRPMPGVRSVGDVLIHVAADNWYGPALMVIEAPAHTGVTNDGSSVRTYQERDLTKAEILEEVRLSFLHLREAARTTTGRLGTPTHLGSSTITYGDLWIRLVTHMHEHLGQLVAYARANEIVPPWSR
jgi:hypothetical protein